MHPNPAFRTRPRDANVAFARDRGFGMLTVNGPDGPHVSHVPFLLSEDGTVVETHLVRSTPLARSLPASAVLAVQGPDGYISPDWYGLPDQVPTWNYVAVHLRGPLEVAPPDALRDLLDRQSALFEERLAPKPVWTTAKMPDEGLARLMRAILPCRMRVEVVEGTWKLGQNKPEAARIAAADGLAAAALSPEARILADLMRILPET
ncbi:Negative transcriptional regulator [Rhodovulum sp. P5]|uniref:FMN-binding negative transcriptional regulator n=1 Tax=Rhodovulum sp. P5 TaxID=1564506 RepID=UPI0009C23987|nr:FMN-binding negative transcriptional regulator [Rhodovulum sp. P5]ARE40798.1 Negative transcriptional regulator [Rhodovulum sp. P5]